MCEKRNGRTGLRFKTINQFFDPGIREGNLGFAAIAVWTMLWRHTRDGVAGVSVSRLARDLGTSERTVLRALNELAGARMLKTVKQGGLSRGITERILAPRLRRKKSPHDTDVTLSHDTGVGAR